MLNAGHSYLLSGDPQGHAGKTGGPGL